MSLQQSDSTRNSDSSHSANVPSLNFSNGISRVSSLDRFLPAIEDASLFSRGAKLPPRSPRNGNRIFTARSSAYPRHLIYRSSNLPRYLARSKFAGRCLSGRAVNNGGKVAGSRPRRRSPWFDDLLRVRGETSRYRALRGFSPGNRKEILVSVNSREVGFIERTVGLNSKLMGPPRIWCFWGGSFALDFTVFLETRGPNKMCKWNSGSKYSIVAYWNY